MRLNLTTTHDITLGVEQAQSECPQAKKARADRDFHSPLIPPLNVRLTLESHTVDLLMTGAVGHGAGGLCPAAEEAGAEVAGASAQAELFPTLLIESRCDLTACAFSQEDQDKEAQRLAQKVQQQEQEQERQQEQEQAVRTASFCWSESQF